MSNAITNSVHVSMSPHDRARATTASVMRDVCIALIPACAMGAYTFGWYALAIIAVSVLACVLSELVYQKLMKQTVTIKDLSAVVTGLILAVNLPATVPLWIPVIGGVFAIIVVKQLFGGIGHNIMNPALAARCFLLISFAGIMTTFPETVANLFTPETVSSATPMASLKAGISTNAFDMIFNTHNGCIGESSPIAIIIGAVYLIARRVIGVRIPVIYVASTIGFVCLINLISGNANLLTLDYAVTHLCGGGLLLGAVFMATDYTTSPITPLGKIVYALLLGLLTAIFRVVGSATEGVSYAIIICNMLVPLIEKLTVPRPFGLGRHEKAAKKQ